MTATASFFSAAPVLLVLFEHVDSLTLLNLRLLCRSIHLLIATYESSIIRQLIRQLELDESGLCLLFHEGVTPTFGTLGRYYFARRLTFWHTSIRRSAWPKCRMGVGQFGRDIDNTIQQTVMRGWIIWQDLADISKKVYAGDAQGNKTSSRLRQATVTYMNKCAKEQEVLRQWLAHTASFSTDELCDLLTTAQCLEVTVTVKTYWADPNGCETRLLNMSQIGREPDAVQWVASFMIRRGLKFVFDLFNRPGVARARAQQNLFAEYEKRDHRTINVERSHMRRFLRDVRERFEQNVCSLQAHMQALLTSTIASLTISLFM